MAFFDVFWSNFSSRPSPQAWSLMKFHLFSGKFSGSWSDALPGGFQEKSAVWWCFFVSYLARFFFYKNSAKSMNVAECEVCWISGKNTKTYTVLFLFIFPVSFAFICGKRISCYLVKDVRNKLPIVHRFCLKSWSSSILLVPLRIMGDPPNSRGKKPCITEGSGIYKPPALRSHDS